MMLKVVAVGMLGATAIMAVKADEKKSKSELLATTGLGFIGFGLLTTVGDPKSREELLKKIKII